jgi:hypothetical protein
MQYINKLMGVHSWVEMKAQALVVSLENSKPL